VHARTDLRRLILPDGRALAFAVYGDPRGFAVVALHQVPGTPATWQPTDAAARAIGVRVVAPERATAAPGPHDLGQLADALGVASFALLGRGDGADLAVVCAGPLADRTTRLGLLDPTTAAPPVPAGLVVRTWRGRDPEHLGEVLAWLRGDGPRPA
jgi:pimeloyl-ACP methyl ester carboxylesterase